MCESEYELFDIILMSDFSGVPGCILFESNGAGLNKLIFQYPPSLRVWLPIICWILVGPIFFVLGEWHEVIERMNSGSKRALFDFFMIAFIAIFGCFYLSSKKIILDDAGVVRSVFGIKTKIKYKDVRKIVRNDSKGNPSAAYTRIYSSPKGGNRKITIDTFIADHEELVAEIYFHCPTAEWVTK